MNVSAHHEAELCDSGSGSSFSAVPDSAAPPREGERAVQGGFKNLHERSPVQPRGAEYTANNPDLSPKEDFK